MTTFFKIFSAKRNSFIGSELLLNKEFPIIFHSIKGDCHQSKDGSSFNQMEVDQVIVYVERLLKNKTRQSDIGIITPYKMQSKLISRECNTKNLNDIEIGTAETFQGKEKEVIIFSPVRVGSLTEFFCDQRVSHSLNKLFFNKN